jgi:hypothetical protein
MKGMVMLTPYGEDLKAQMRIQRPPRRYFGTLRAYEVLVLCLLLAVLGSVWAIYLWGQP